MIFRPEKPPELQSLLVKPTYSILLFNEQEGLIELDTVHEKEMLMIVSDFIVKNRGKGYTFRLEVTEENK